MARPSPSEARPVASKRTIRC